MEDEEEPWDDEYIEEGVILFDRGEFSQALDEFTNLNRTYPFDCTINIYIATLIFITGEYESAMRRYQYAASINEEEFRAHFGLVARKLDDYAETMDDSPEVLTCIADLQEFVSTNARSIAIAGFLRESKIEYGIGQYNTRPMCKMCGAEMEDRGSGMKCFKCRG